MTQTQVATVFVLLYEGLLHYYYGRYYLLVVFLSMLSITDIIFCVRCIQSQQLPLSLRCQTLLLSKQEVKYLGSSE